MTRITDALPRWGRALALALHALPALAAASTQGGQAVLRQWPGRPFSLIGAGETRSAPFMLARNLQSTLAEVRLAEGDTVQLLVLELQGRCITPAEIQARYAQLRNADFPQPDNPDPVSYRRVQIDGVRVSFGFRGALPGCLTHVVFNPQAH